MTPTVFREGPFRVHFFSLEEPRMHVHVVTSEGEAKFWMEPEIELAKNYGLSEQIVSRSLRLILSGSRRYVMCGTNTSRTPEVANISPHGFWLLVDERELFLDFKTFPWFKDATVAAISNVERPQPHHLYWPDLDVDLTVDSIEDPERYPLRARH